MAERELITARAKAERSHADLMTTIATLKSRLKPASLASDAWGTVKQKGSQASGQGIKVVTDHPGPAGGVVMALALFFLRGPIAHLVTRLFRETDGAEHIVTTDILENDTDFDLTAPVVIPAEGKKQ